MDTKDLKIISESKLKKAKEDFGVLLREIEFYKDNPKFTKRTDILRIMKRSIEFRDTLNDL